MYFRIALLVCALVLAGCSSLDPREVVEDSSPRLDEMDQAVADALVEYLPPLSAWGPRAIIPSDDMEFPVQLLRSVNISSLAWFPRLLPRLEAGLNEAGFQDYSIEAPEGTFASVKVRLGENLISEIKFLQEIEARMAVVVDDVGNSRANENLLLEIDLPLTLAILPRLPYTTYWDGEGAERGFEIILHCPLQAINSDLELGPGGIKSSMGQDELVEILDESLSGLPHVVGCNNHMGSSFTTDTGAMTVMLRELDSRGLYFIDSLTISGTVTEEIAGETGARWGARDIFLDHENTTEKINEQFDRAVEMALSRGGVIAIGHYRRLSLEILNRRLGELSSFGIQLVPASLLLENP